MEPGVSASDSQAPVLESHLWARKRAQRGLEEALRTHTINGLRTTTCHSVTAELIWKADGTHLTDMKLGTKSSVVGLRLYWEAGLVVIILQVIILGPSVQKAQNPATEAVRAEGPEALSHGCPWGHSYHSFLEWSSPPAVAFSPRSKCLGKGLLELVGTSPEPGPRWPKNSNVTHNQPAK